ncbi:class I SAM-dependent methyltransferase [Spirulina sp. 06S082]|uniref:class I SAM-dependent methyltransferase n=1 Tax=Spirulina sp. 06S082 TaxID=3110248 RepID=UPI002B200296|nr:class I SAM-dependent methyltransferase [Spirulina sp. 06S082]
MDRIFKTEIEQGRRFEFGKNWKRFLTFLNEERIIEAENSLKDKLGLTDLEGKTFLDIGSGSGLFSLAARRLGGRVHSLDYDPDSIACTEELKHRYCDRDSQWTIERGSVLDTDYLAALGQFDIVYSWGVLHHTGQMWKALENVVPLVANGGRLFISIYNDGGRSSKMWRQVKVAYNQSSPPLRGLIVGLALMRLWGPTTVRDLLTGQPFKTWRSYSQHRGMSPLPDVVDWVGGYPFEVAKPEEIFEFYRQREFTLQYLKTCAGGHGCNEYVFQKQ